MLICFGGKINCKKIENLLFVKMEVENNISCQEQLKDFLQNEVEKLENKIKKLEDETDLQERLSVGEFSIDDLKRFSFDIEESGYLKDQNSMDKSLEEKGIELKVESLEGLTGIKFDNCELKKLKDSTAEKTLLKWQRHLSGKCYGLKFSVDFIVIESTVEEVSNTSKDTLRELQEEYKARLNDLEVNVLNPLATREFQPFNEKVKEENNLCLFFQVLMQYAAWFHHRQRTFEHFKSKYPHIVHLVYSSKQLRTVMQMINPVSPNDVFTISWQIHIGEFGNVIPQIDLFNYNSKLKRKTELGKSLPLYFRKMLSVFGIEQAIELVLGIVARKSGYSS